MFGVQKHWSVPNTPQQFKVVFGPGISKSTQFTRRNHSKKPQFNVASVRMLQRLGGSRLRGQPIVARISSHQRGVRVFGPARDGRQHGPGRGGGFVVRRGFRAVVHRSSKFFARVHHVGVFGGNTLGVGNGAVPQFNKEGQVRVHERVPVQPRVGVGVPHPHPHPGLH